MIIINKDFKWSPDGNKIETVKAGQYKKEELSEGALTAAEQMGCTKKKVNTPENKSHGPSPLNKTMIRKGNNHG